MKTARDEARAGNDIRPGTKHFWAIIGDHLAEVGDLLAAIHAEVEEERRAAEVAGTGRRCIVCNDPVVKKHVRGRWPIYCDNCGLGDRKGI